MKNSRIVIILIMIALLTAAVTSFVAGRAISEDFRNIQEEIKGLKRQAYHNLPIYSDYMSGGREKKLRTHLLADHLAFAESMKLEAAADRDSIERLIDEKKLVKIERNEDSLFYFYNLPRDNRYLRDFALAGLEDLAEEFQKTLQARGYKGKVKFAVTSALRGEKYQQSLRRRNRNAVVKSSHAFGISFDVFFDEFFAVIEKKDSSVFTDKNILKKQASQAGYLLGGNMRRQFKAAMAETLIRLQDQGLLYAILEKRQRCFHVTILKAQE